LHLANGHLLVKSIDPGQNEQLWNGTFQEVVRQILEPPLPKLLRVGQIYPPLARMRGCILNKQKANKRLILEKKK
jgi:hypothetical protein